MKAVILAGGLPSTITEENEGIPKPMVEIGEKPIIWHIMKNLSHYGVNDFIVCSGYKSDMIKNYFNDYYIYHSDITVNLKNNTIKIHKNITEDWHVTVADTGLKSSTNERIRKVKPYIGDESFILTYGDCLSNIDINIMTEIHRKNGLIATMAIARPTGRNQTLNIDKEGRLCKDYLQQNETSAWANTGTYIFTNGIFNYLEENDSIERQPIQNLVKDLQVMTYKHDEFWRPVETKRDKEEVIQLWNEGLAPWKVWQEY
ncbi:MAG: sugar phosphate nucleotidyltransferase [Herbinix sp.]|nr:sugar phosphate nucleotidyltransferase [Herbinix sp.]